MLYLYPVEILWNIIQISTVNIHPQAPVKIALDLKKNNCPLGITVIRAAPVSSDCFPRWAVLWVPIRCLRIKSYRRYSFMSTSLSGKHNPGSPLEWVGISSFKKLGDIKVWTGLSFMSMTHEKKRDYLLNTNTHHVPNLCWAQCMYVYFAYILAKSLMCHSFFFFN